MRISLSSMKWFTKFHSPPFTCSWIDILWEHGGLYHPQDAEVKKSFHCAPAAWGKALEELRQRESLPVVQLCFYCALAATKTGRLKKAMEWVICSLWAHCGDCPTVPLAESKLCSQQPGHQFPRCVEWYLAVEWAPAGRGQKLWHEERPVLQHGWQPRTPHLELGLLILGRSDLHPSQLISSLHKWVLEEAGSGARVHGRVHYRDIDIIHVWHDKNFL